MNKTCVKVIAASLALFGAVEAPVIPTENKLLYSFQQDLTKPQDPEAVPLPEEIKDEDGNGLISVAVFLDEKGEKILEQIPDDTYRKMGERDGILENPKRESRKSIISASRANAAIARDVGSSADNGPGFSSTSVTWSHTNSGNFMLVHSRAGVTDVVTGATYNGVALTQLGTAIVATAGDRYLNLFYTNTPAAGANNVVVNASGNVAYIVMATTYSGVKTTGFPDANTTNTTLAASSLTTSITVVGSNCWITLPGYAINAGIGAGTGSTLFQTSTNNQTAFFDTNGTVTAGLQSMEYTFAAGTGAVFMASFCPAVAATSGFQLWSQQLF